MGINNILEATKPYFSLIKQIKDDKFDVDHLENYRLALHVGNDEFQISIFDLNSKCLLIEDYNLIDVKNSEECIEALSSIFESHHLLKAGFWNEIKVSFKNKKWTLLPYSIFDENNAEDYLQLICEVDPVKEDVHYFNHDIKGNFVSVYATDTKILNWLQSNYASIPIKTLHQSSIVIEGVLQYNHSSSMDGVFIYLNRNNLHISVTSRKQLQYYNVFNCNTPEEFVRYILLVFQELRLDPNQIKVTLWGSFDVDSPYYKNLYKYIRHVSFASKPSFLKFNFQFDELFDHEYLDLYSINLC